MSNTLRKIRKAERQSMKVPKSVQQAIPIRKVYADGIFKCDNYYSKTMKFTDINYRVAGKDDQEDMFRSYCDLINSIDTEAITKLTINNRMVIPHSLVQILSSSSNWSN